MRAPGTPSSEPEGAGEALRNQSKDGRQVEGADLGRRSANWAEETQIDGPDRGRRGGGGRFPKAYPAAARRLPLRLAADHRASDALVVAPLSAAAWDRAVAGYRGRQRVAEDVQDLSDRLLPRRHRRSADRARQALSLRRHRPHLEVRGRSARRQGQHADRTRLLGGPRGRPCPTGSRSCSPTTTSNSPTCQRADQVQPPSFAGILSRTSVGSTGSNID